MKKQVIAMLLTAVVTAAALTGCGGSTQQQSAAPAAEEKKEETAEAAGEETAAAAADLEKFLIISNNLGVGVYSTDLIAESVVRAIESVNGDADVADNKFTVDNTVSQLQSQLAMQPDGVVYLSVAQNLFLTMAENCQKANVPFSFYAIPPSEEDFDQIAAGYDQFCGSVSYDPWEEGVACGERALKDGCKTAVVSAGAAGDWGHDNRTNGFKETFEAGGGQVLAIAHSTDPSEGVTKTSDLLTAHPDVDCVYGAGEDYIVATLSVKSTKGLDNLKVYGSAGISPECIKAIVDGKANMVTGGETASGSYAAMLTMNALYGDKIVDENGNPPRLVKPCVIVDETNAEAFDKYITDKGFYPISGDITRDLLKKLNPNVDYAYFKSVVENSPQQIYDVVNEYAASH